MYTTPTCAYCKMTKQFFAQHNIQYVEKDVLDDTQAREEMVEKSGQMGVPVIDIDGQIVVGYDKAKLSRLLNIG